MTLLESLLYAMTKDGVLAVLGFFSFWLIPWFWPAFSEKTKAQKRTIYLGLSLGIPLSAAVLLLALGYEPFVGLRKAIEYPLWPAARAGAAAFFASQAMHLRELRQTE